MSAATKNLELLKQKDETEISFNIEKIVGKLLRTQNTRPCPLYLPLQDSNLNKLVSIDDWFKN